MQWMPLGRATRTTVALLATLVALAACTAGPLQGDYSRASVQPVEVAPAGSNKISIRYSMPGETLFYSPGVDFRSANGVLQVAIRRCSIKNTRCTPKAKATGPRDNPWQPEVVLPYHGEKVMMMYRDGRRQVFPATPSR